MGQSGRSEEYPLRLAPPIYRGKFRGRYRDDGRKMATSRFYRDKFRWPLQEDAAVLTMVPDRVRTGLACAAEQRTGRSVKLLIDIPDRWGILTAHRRRFGMKH